MKVYLTQEQDGVHEEDMYQVEDCIVTEAEVSELTSVPFGVRDAFPKVYGMILRKRIDEDTFLIKFSSEKGSKFELAKLHIRNGRFMTILYIREAATICVTEEFHKKWAPVVEKFHVTQDWKDLHKLWDAVDPQREERK